MRSAPKLLLTCLAVGFLCGCVTSRKPETPIDPETTKASEVSRKQQKAAERAFNNRVKALTHYAAGLSSQYRNEPAKELEHYLESLEADPSNQSLALSVAGQLLQKLKIDDAIEVLERASKSKNSAGEIHARLGVYYRRKNQLEKAAEASESAIRKSPDKILGYRTLYQIHSTARRPAEALAILKRAAAVRGPDTPFLIQVAGLFTAYLSANPAEVQTERAGLLDLLNRIESRRSKRPQDLERLAQMYEFAGQADKAKTFRQRIVSDQPSNVRSRWNLYAHYLRNDDVPAAILQLDELLAIQPTNAEFNYFRGALASDSDNREDAEIYYTKAILFNEQDPRPYFALTGLLISQDKSDAALELLDKARKSLGRASFNLEYFTALAYSNKKDYESSVRHYLKAEITAKQDEPRRLDHIFYFQMAATYERNQDYAQATRIFLNVLQMKPDFVDALNYLGYMWAERGEHLVEARQMIEKAVAAEPDNPAYLDSMGWVLYMSGKLHESIPWLLRSVELSDVATEDDPTLFEHLGDAYFAIGDHNNARIQFRKALTIEDKPEIQRKLKETIQLLKP